MNPILRSFLSLSKSSYKNMCTLELKVVLTVQHHPNFDTDKTTCLSK